MDLVTDELQARRAAKQAAADGRPAGDEEELAEWLNTPWDTEEPPADPMPGRAQPHPMGGPVGPGGPGS